MTEPHPSTLAKRTSPPQGPGLAGLALCVRAQGDPGHQLASAVDPRGGLQTHHEVGPSRVVSGPALLRPGLCNTQVVQDQNPPTDIENGIRQPEPEFCGVIGRSAHIWPSYVKPSEASQDR